MKDIIILVSLIICAFILIKIFLKITSFILKVIIWLCIISVVVYILNYYVLPKLGKQPLPIKEYILNVVREKKIKEKLKPSVDKTVKRQIEKVQQETKRFFSTKEDIKQMIQKIATYYYSR